MYNMPDLSSIFDSKPEVSSVQRTGGIMQRARLEVEREEPYDAQSSIMNHMRKYRESAEPEETPEEESTTGVVTTGAIRPRARGEGGGPQSLTEQAAPLLQDEGFTAKLEEMEAKYPGLTRLELFKMIKGESSFNPRARNPSGASGLFQFIPPVARELGTSPEAILAMSPREQLDLYDRYLQRWNYDGRVSLGVVQAAPAFANASPDTVVYARGTKAWEQNPGWRPRDGGDITVATIDNYYRRQ